MSEGEDRESPSPPGWYPYGEGRQAWWDGEAFGHVTPLAPSRPMQPAFAPYKPRIGKNATIPLVLLGLVLTVGLIVGLANLDYSKFEERAPERTVTQPDVVDPSDGCYRTYDLLKGVQQSAVMTDEEVAARLRGLRDAARANDPQLADKVQQILDTADETTVRDILYRLLNRCGSVGDLTPEQLAEVGVGPATTF